MSVAELKERLIFEITNTENEELLSHISDLFEFEYNEPGLHIMSEGEIEAVKEGIAQLSGASG